MDIETKDRTALKAYFVKNAIPTESNFAELIDATLNQRDDGIVKLAGNPLSIEAAAGAVTTEKKALSLYESFADASPAWVLSLTSDAAATPLGFGISDGAGNLRLFIDRSSGNVGIGTSNPGNKVDIQPGDRTGTHPSGLALYVTGYWKPAGDGVEFRHLNATQGIGFGYNTIYATGSDANQDLNLQARGTGVVRVKSRLTADGDVGIGTGTAAPQARLQVSGGAFMPAVGAGVNAGILFPPDPAGGGGDKAWIRYYATSGENTTFEIGTSNDPDDHIALMASGNVGIGTTTPIKDLHIRGAGSAPILNDGADRPGMVISGDYPELTLFSGIANPKHGPTIRLGGYFEPSLSSWCHWSIGTAARNGTFLDFGYSGSSDPNVHAGIRNLNGLTVMTLYADGNVWANTRSGGGVDYAEYFESSDGNEIPAGTAVVLEADNVRPAREGEVPIGIISANPGIVGGAHIEWPHKYLRDVFGNTVADEQEEGRRRLNPEYDESREYVPREERPEWNCVGLLGKLPLRKGQPVADSWIKMKDLSDEVELWLVK